MSVPEWAREKADELWAELLRRAGTTGMSKENLAAFLAANFVPKKEAEELRDASCMNALGSNVFSRRRVGKAIKAFDAATADGEWE